MLSNEVRAFVSNGVNNIFPTTMSSLSRLSEITRVSMRRCEYDVTKQLMRNSAHKFHRRLTFVNTVTAAGFGGIFGEL